MGLSKWASDAVEEKSLDLLNPVHLQYILTRKVRHDTMWNSKSIFDGLSSTPTGLSGLSDIQAP